jgi:hypothetical protein
MSTFGRGKNVRPVSLFLFLLLSFVFFGCGTIVVSPSVLDNIIAGNFSGTAIGAFVNGFDNFASFEADSGQRLAVVLWYVSWQSPFPTADADTVYANGSVPLITWEPWISNSIGTLEAIASGSYESYVRGFIQSAKDWGQPLFLRFAHEMNGNWYPWSGQPENYIRAWRYIYNVKNELKASNVIMVWCPNNDSVPTASWNTIASYYPGDAYVDWIGLDGYNFGVADWETFDAVFSGAYATLTALTSKPLMIGEFACAEDGGDKPAWISDAFTKIEASYPRIKSFAWFNINKERDWRIQSSAAAQAAYKNSLQNSYYLDRIL